MVPVKDEHVAGPAKAKVKGRRGADDAGPDDNDIRAHLEAFLSVRTRLAAL